MAARDELWPIALGQYGFITTVDAREAGVAPNELAKLASRNRLAHVGHGLYRFPELPETGRDDYMRAVLAVGEPNALLSHDTALAVHELCDINPDTVHVTIPRASRVRRTLPGITIHRDNLEATDRDWWEGIPVVTPATAIGQGIQAGVPHQLLTQAIRTARRNHFIDAKQTRRLRAMLRERAA
ncbi:type IV toxin-antitoxin system AbiEi family antitoxin domain-containing protein [Rathayibacter sp. AY1E9]|uniref:type IV toxin-antitoxin system AbiEi family antitoxin domain-containing protein n=1 Tax=Rathayibacter sp. AY1E9 TaxID=2080556 RepID=UPI0015E21FC2|nr:type IV toxin-antitoxin system AbiEi family antitoxin domain-containing protein [Rathayibacter sp. AY1E9]